MRFAELGRRYIARLNAQKLWTVAFCALMIAVISNRLALLPGLAGYARHFDERKLLFRAIEILRNHNLDPHGFHYPSLPIYIVAASMGAAQLVSSHSLVDAWQPTQPGGPIFPLGGDLLPRVALSSLSFVTLALVAITAKRLYRASPAILLAPLLLSTSVVFQTSSIRYLNVDIVAATAVAATAMCVVVAWERQSYLWKSIVPGVLVGLAVASKYNSGVSLLSPLLAILLTKTPCRTRKLALLAGVTALTFLLCVPYSMLEPGRFVRDVLAEIEHYATGHRGHDGPAGIPQMLFYLRSLADDFGPLLMGFAVLGLVVAGVKSPRRALAVAVLPLAMLVHMSTNRVHFLRTVLPVFVLFPVFAAGGVCGVADWIAGLLEKRILSNAPRWIRSAPWHGLALVLTTGVLFAAHPPGALFDRNLAPDSRVLVREWLAHNASGAPVFVAPEAHFSIPRLRNHNIVAEQTSVEISNLGPLSARVRRGACLIVVPGYEESRKARAAARRISSRVRAVGAAPVFRAPGKLSKGPSRWGRLARPVLDPELAVYRFPCGKQ